MLLLDLSSIVIPEVIFLTSVGKEKLSEDLVRRIVISQIITYKNKYVGDYSPLVICADSRNYWRKDIFPHYKCNRKKYRKESHLNWEEFYIYFGRIKEEIKNIRGFTLLEIERLEADDIIAILSKRYSQVKNVMIVSLDKDLIQLQTYSSNIEQFSPKTKKKLTLKNKEYSLMEHIIRGDSSDGIPNILSDDDVFLDANKRQKQIRKAFVNEAKSWDEEKWLSAFKQSVVDKYYRNKTLIDLNCIPKEYTKKVIETYENVVEQPKRKKSSLFDYAIKHKLRKVIDQLGAIK